MDNYLKTKTNKTKGLKMKVVKFKTVDQYAMAIQDELQKAECSIKLASEIFVDCIDTDVKKSKKLKEMLGLSESTYISMEKIGRGQVDERLIFAGNNARRKLLSMPLSNQKQALDEGIEVLVDNNDVLRVQVDNLNSNQLKQVFKGDHIRSIAEQKNYLCDRKKQLEYAAVIEKKRVEPPKRVIERKREPVKPDYEIKGGKLIVNREQVFTRKQIFDIMAKLV